MKVTRIYNQNRRDCTADLECEGCGAKRTASNAYDDANYWDNVVPNFKCEKCGKSTNDMGATPTKIKTRYAANEVV